MVMADSLRKDHVGYYGNGWIKTPSIDKIASEGVVFDYAYAEGLPTIPVRTSLFTGRYTLPFRGWQPLERDDLLIAEFLWNKGYVSSLISDTYHLHKPRMGFERGFDYVEWIRGQEYDPYILDRDVEDLLKKYSEKNYGGTGESSSIPRLDRVKEMFKTYLRNVADWKDEEDHFIAQVVKAGTSWLKKVMSKGRRDKLFLWLDCFDPHEPWDPPNLYYEMYAVDEYDGLPIILPQTISLTLPELRHVRAQYAGEVTLVDKWIGVLMEEVDNLGLLENTLLIFLSDHGEPLGEHGLVRKGQPWPYEELSHIPLIIKFPDSMGIKHKRIRSFVGMPDIMPTILDFFSIKGPETMHGKSLLPLVLEGEKEGERNFGISGHFERAWSIRNCEWSFYTWLKPPMVQEFKKKNELYRVDMNFVPSEPSKYNPEEDLAEKENLINEEKEIAGELESKLTSFIEKIRSS